MVDGPSKGMCRSAPCLPQSDAPRRKRNGCPPALQRQQLPTSLRRYDFGWDLRLFRSGVLSQSFLQQMLCHLERSLAGFLAKRSRKICSCSSTNFRLATREKSGVSISKGREMGIFTGDFVSF